MRDLFSVWCSPFRNVYVSSGNTQAEGGDSAAISNIYFSIDFNFIYDILNIIKSNKKGELNWR